MQTRDFPPKTPRSPDRAPPALAVERLGQLRAEQAERRLMLGSGWTDLDPLCEAGEIQPSPDRSGARAAVSGDLPSSATVNLLAGVSIPRECHASGGPVWS